MTSAPVFSSFPSFSQPIEKNGESSRSSAPVVERRKRSRSRSRDRHRHRDDNRDRAGDRDRDGRRDRNRSGDRDRDRDKQRDEDRKRRKEERRQREMEEADRLVEGTSVGKGKSGEVQRPRTDDGGGAWYESTGVRGDDSRRGVDDAAVSSPVDPVFRLFRLLCERGD